MKAEVINNDVIWRAQTYHYSWIDSDDKNDFIPCILVAGACFDRNGKLLIMHEYGEWRIPGGGPRKGESPLETLKREMFEEVNIELGKTKLLGAFKIEGPDPKKYIQYHLCYYAFITKVMPRKADPEEGKIHEYKLIDPTEVSDYVKWDVTGAAMFRRAIDESKLSTSF